MTRRWQFYDYLNTRIGCGAEDRKGYILPTVKTTARGITMS
jgi:hypothetical protein